MKTVPHVSLSKETNLVPSGRLQRGSAGLMAGALFLGILASAPALAELGKKHEPQYRPQSEPGYQTRHHAPHRADPRAQHHPRHRVEHAPRMQRGPRYSPPAPVVYQEPLHHAGPPGYRFSGENRSYLQAHYRDSLRSVRLDRRPHFAPGRVIPHAYRPHISRLPPHLGYRLPPPPRGYHVGYYQGYSVVYDPLTFMLLGVLDLVTR